MATNDYFLIFSCHYDRDRGLDLELAQYKLAVGDVLNDVQQVSDTLEKSAKTLPINQTQKQEILEQLSESTKTIEQAELMIDSEIDELTEVNERPHHNFPAIDKLPEN